MVNKRPHPRPQGLTLKAVSPRDISIKRQNLTKIGDPTKTLRNVVNKRPHTRQQGVTLKSVSPRDIYKIRLQLKDSNSSGLDNLNTYPNDSQIRTYHITDPPSTSSTTLSDRKNQRRTSWTSTAILMSFEI